MGIGFRSIGALRAIRLSDATRSALGDSYAQLSSGKRITKPSDDPGGLAVSMSLAVEAKISDRAKLNIEDGVSLSSYAEAAFDSATDIVQRLNELASQAANGILGSKQRDALNSEFTALTTELTRIQKSSQFNGILVNNGDAVSASAKRVGAAGSGNFEMSADGRYAFYVESSTLKMRDTMTDQITSLATSVTSSDIGVSAAGDKIAYTTGSGVQLYDRLTGTSSTIIGSAISNGALEISGDGSTVAVISRMYYAADGTNPRSDGGYHMTIYDVASQQIRGDNATFRTVINNGWDLALSYNGDYVAFRGAESNLLSTTAEIATFATNDLTKTYYVTSSSNRLTDRFAIDNSGNTYAVVGSSAGTIQKYSLAVPGGQTLYGSSANLIGGADAGGSLVFYSSSNITGGNSGLYRQLFKLDVSSGEVRQLSNFSSNLTITTASKVSGDGYSFLHSNGSVFDYYDFSPRLSVNIDTGNGAAGLVGVGISSLDGAARALTPLQIDSVSSAKSAIFQLSRTLENLGLAQSALGASVSRLQSSSRATASKGLEQKAAFGRVSDVDVAESAGEAIRLQILNQSQVGIIAQASKLSPQIALKLLVGP